MTSQELIRAQRAGAKILHNGAPVHYRPRGKGDREPWVFYNGREEVRYPASGCQAVYPR
ncbi:hypothetical protein ACFWFX_15440 [Streptomyces roseolus]|uniref:hypothetical protein n=1 Tax=Streptomyces roseolus TaxID=67358 RepID=UPI0036588720